MIYKNVLRTKKSLVKKIKISSFKNGINTNYDDALMPIGYSKNTYNFSFKSGALKTGLGIDKLNLKYHFMQNYQEKTINNPTHTNVIGSWVYKCYNNQLGVYMYYLIIYCNDKKLYYNNVRTKSVEFYELLDVEFNEKPNIINYKLNSEDVIIISSKTSGMYVWGDETLGLYKVESAPNITDMAIHYERLFATIDGAQTEVWFSDDLDPTNWTVALDQAGFIQMADERGPSKKVISLNDYLYVFRDYGITRITAYGSQSEFSVSNLHYLGSKIYKNTVCSCGDNIMFLSDDGIFVFNGINASKLNLNIDALLEPTNLANASYHNGKYYLALRFKYDDDALIGSETKEDEITQINNTLLAIDTKTGEIEILRGVNVLNMHPINLEFCSKLVVVSSDGTKSIIGELSQSGQYFSDSNFKYWESVNSDLGYSDSVKIVRELNVKNKHPFTLEVISDLETKEFSVDCKKAINKIKMYVRGNIFKFVFKTNKSQAHISDPQITFEVL